MYGLFSPVILYIGCALGALGIALALPRRGLSPRVVGAILAGLGLGGIFLALGLRAGRVGALPNIHFYIFSVIALFGAVRVISHPRPVYAALYFILTILSSCGLYVLLSAEFLAFALVIVYAGAILITYMFVIMLATEAPSAEEAEALAEYDRYSREPEAAAVVGFVLVAALTTMLGRGAAGLTDPTARAAAARVPVDVLGVQAQPGRRATDNPTLLVRLRAAAPTSGLIGVTVEGNPVDLNPASPEMGLPVELVAGENAIGGIVVPVALTGEVRIEAAFVSASKGATGDETLLAQLPGRVEAALRDARDPADPAKPLLRPGEKVKGIDTASRTAVLVTPTDERGDGPTRVVPMPPGLHTYNVEGVAFTLLNDHPGSIEIAGVVLLMAMLGAVVLARKKVEMDERAKLAAQQRHLEPSELERPLAEVPESTAGASA